MSASLHAHTNDTVFHRRDTTSGLIRQPAPAFCRRASRSLSGPPCPSPSCGPPGGGLSGLNPPIGLGPIPGDGPDGAPQIPLNFGFSYGCTACGDPNVLKTATDSGSSALTFPHNGTHNIHAIAAIYKLTVMYVPYPPYMVYVPTWEYPDVSTTVTVNNMTLDEWQNDDDWIKLWDPASMQGVNLSCSWTDSQTGSTMARYTTAGATVFDQPTTTKEDTTAWNGKNALNQTAPFGLYPVTAFISSTVPDTNETVGGCSNRSTLLSVESVTCVPCGYSAASQQYKFMVTYTLKDNANAEEGKIWFYYPQSATTYGHATFSIPDAGLTASGTGVVHHQIIAVSKSEIDDPLYVGKPRYVALHIRDGHKYHNDYKDHKGHFAVEPVVSIAFPLVQPVARNYDGSHGCGGCADIAMAKQKDMPDGSCYEAYSHTDADSAVAMTEAGSATIVFIVNHGSPGTIILNGDPDGSNSGWAGANAPPGCVTIGANAFPQAKLVAFVGCETGQTGTLYGNLLSAATAAGASCSFGFTEPVRFSTGGSLEVLSWTEFFWNAATGNSITGPPLSVGGALAYARDRVKDKYHYYKGFDTFVSKGDSGTMLAPALGK